MMRKLAVAALSFSAATFAANYVLALEWLMVPAVLLAVSGAALSALGRKWLRGAVIALLFCSLGLLNYYVQYRLTYARAEALAGQTRTVRLRLTDYAVSYGDYCRLEGRIVSGDLPGLRAIAYDNTGTAAGAGPGDLLTMDCRLGTADTLYGKPYEYYKANDVYFKLSSRGPVALERGSPGVAELPARLSRLLSDRVDRVFSPDTAHFMRSLMLGDRSGLYGDEALMTDLSRAGFMHIVAVSGMHIAFLVGFIRLVLGASPPSSLLCIALVWGFTLITGGSPSTVRAAVMQSLLLSASVFHRENDPLTSLSAALALILLQNPFSAASVSLQLSFGAMAGIMCFSGRIYRALSAGLPRGLRLRAVDYLLASLSSSVGVMVFTAPLTAVHFGYVPLLSALTNMAGLWAVSLCFCGGWISCALSAIPGLEALSAWLCQWLARYIFLVARLVSDIPFAALYMQTQGAWLWLWVSCGLFALALAVRIRPWLRLLAPALLSAALLAGVLISARLRYSTGPGVFSVIDVGQGQSVAAMCGHSTVVIDCGNSFSIEDAGELTGAYLRSYGRDRIDLLVLSHLHADHANGAATLMELMEVGALVMPGGAGDPDGLREDIEACAARHGTELYYVNEKLHLQCGGIELDLLPPLGGGDENERCLTAVLSMGDFDGLLTADSTAEMERELLLEPETEDVELLLVSHHGSKYSSCPEFLRGVAGDWAVISTGYNNYGHPAEETLEALADCGYNVLRTDADGTVEIRLG